MGADPTFDPTVFRDLRDDGHRSTGTSAPADEVGRLAAQMLERIDEVTDLVVRRVVDQVPAYKGGDVVKDDLWWSCHRNASFVLRLLLENRNASEEELRVRRALGVRRAKQGMPVEDILQAFHVGCMVLWDHIVSLGQQHGQTATDLLLERAGRIWGHMHEVSTAVMQAHRMEISRREAAAQHGPAAFLRDLRRWPEEDHAVQSARDVGFDPEGWFLAAVHLEGGHVAWPRPSIVVNQPDRSVVMVMADPDLGTCERDLATALQQAGADSIGIGLARRGLSGARQSLHDAARAHAVASKECRRSASFRQDWFSAVALDHREDLGQVVRVAVALLEEDPELRATVDAYLRAEGRLSRAATYLHVHPNTVSYRLDRLSRKAGIDVRCPAGQLDARLALTLTRP